MKEFTHKIEPNDSHAFKGEALIAVPKYKERLQMLKDVNLKFDEKGAIDINTNQIDMAMKFADIAVAHVKSIKVKKDGEEYKSIDDLEYDVDGGALISELGSVVVSGIKMGKHSKTK